MILLTPGPLTTARETREAMLSDWGSRDTAFIDLTAALRRRLLALAHGENTHACVPIQGSEGTKWSATAFACLLDRSPGGTASACATSAGRPLTERFAGHIGPMTDSLNRPNWCFG